MRHFRGITTCVFILMVAVIAGPLSAEPSTTQPSADQKRAARRIPARPRPPKFQETPAQPTRIQGEILVIWGQKDQLAKLDSETLGQDNPTAEQLFQRCAAVGQTELLTRFDQTIDLTARSRLEHSHIIPINLRSPTPQGPRNTPRITYAAPGCRAEITGQWTNEADTATADLQLKIDCKWLSMSDRQADKADNPMFGQCKIEKNIRLPEGRPTTLASESTVMIPGQDKNNLTMLTVVHLRATKAELWPTETERESNANAQPKNESNNSAASATKPTPEANDNTDQTVIQITIIEFKNDKITPSGWNMSKLFPPGATGNEVNDILTKLKESGEIVILGRPAINVQSGQSAKIKVNDDVPQIKNTRQNGDKDKSQIKDEDLGTTIEIKAHWLDEIDPYLGEAEVYLQIKSVAESTALSSDVSLPSFHNFTLDKTVRLHDGRPVWLTSTEFGDARTDKGGKRPICMIVLTPKRLNPPEAKAAPSQRKEPQALSPLTRVEIDLVTLSCKPEALPELKIEEWRKQDLTARQLVDRLTEYGTVDTDHHLILEPTDLSKTASIRNGSQVPLVKNMRIGKDGKVSPSVKYEDCGIECRLNGQWVGKQLKLNLEMSNKDQLQNKFNASPVSLPVENDQRISQSLILESGKASLLIQVDDALGMDKDQIKVSFLRLCAIRVPEMNENTIGHPATPAEVATLTHLQTEVFEVACHTKDLLTVNPDVWASTSMATPDKWLDNLRALGPVRLMYRADGFIILDKEMRLTNGEQTPVIRDATVSGLGTAAPRVTYEDLGRQLQILGRWRSDPSPIADLYIEFARNNLAKSSIEPSPGIHLPVFSKQEVGQQITVRSGRPVCLYNSLPPLPGDPDSLPKLIAIRLTATRMEK